MAPVSALIIRVELLRAEDLKTAVTPRPKRKGSRKGSRRKSSVQAATPADDDAQLRTAMAPVGAPPALAAGGGESPHPLTARRHHADELKTAAAPHPKRKGSRKGSRKGRRGKGGSKQGKVGETPTDDAQLQSAPAPSGESSTFLRADVLLAEGVKTATPEGEATPKKKRSRGRRGAGKSESKGRRKSTRLDPPPVATEPAPDVVQHDGAPPPQ